MADAEHLALLESGVGGWNKWRANNPRKETLHGADLSGKDHSGANLSWAELSGIVAELNLPRTAVEPSRGLDAPWSMAPPRTRAATRPGSR